MLRTILIAAVAPGLCACTQETQNEIGRNIQNWTGTNGVLHGTGLGTVIRVEARGRAD